MFLIENCDKTAENPQINSAVEKNYENKIQSLKNIPSSLQPYKKLFELKILKFVQKS